MTTWSRPLIIEGLPDLFSPVNMIHAPAHYADSNCTHQRAPEPRHLYARYQPGGQREQCHINDNREQAERQARERIEKELEDRLMNVLSNASTAAKIASVTQSLP